MTRSRLGILLTALALSLIAASTAQAARSEFYGTAQGGADFDDQDAQGMAAAGVRTVRFALDWPLVEPAPGDFRWNYWDRLIGDLASRGIRTVPFPVLSPSWVEPATNVPPLDNVWAKAYWQRFLKEAVARYGPGGSYWATKYHTQFGANATPRPVQSWQIWTEPTFQKWWQPAGGAALTSVSKYVQLLQLSHDAIKSKDPNARIVLAGVAHGGTPLGKDFLNILYTSFPGAKSDFDAAAFHPYSTSLDQFRQFMDEFRAVMTSHGDGATPLWITEVGWGSADPSTDPTGHNKGLTGQATLLQDAFNLILNKRSAWNIQRVFWFDWRDPDPLDPPNQLCSFCASAGLLNFDRSAKPSYDKYKAFATDSTPPQASITAGPSAGGFTKDSTPTFSFASSEPGSTFACRYDATSFKACSSPYTLPGLADGAHTFYVKAIDAVGNESTVVSRSFTVDTVAPTVTAPGQSLVVQTQLGQGVPVRLSWSGSDDRTSQANLKFDLLKRTYQSGAWSAWSSVAANTSLRATTLSLTPNIMDQFEVRSRDQAGNVSAFKTGSAFTPKLLQESAATYTGTWSSAAETDASGGSVEVSKKAGATATFAFTGSSVAVVMPVRLGLGSVKICLDPGTASESCASVNLGDPTGLGPRKLVFARNGLSTASQHHVEVTVLSGTAELDALAFVL